MQSDITVDLNLNIPEKGIELARLIFDVSQECDISCSHSRTLDLNNFADKIMNKFEIFRVQQENSHLPPSEIQKLVDTMVAENHKKRGCLAAEKVAKREKVKHLIHENASEGYNWAYRLCKDNNTDEAKALAYRLMHHLESLSVEEKLEISRL